MEVVENLVFTWLHSPAVQERVSHVLGRNIVGGAPNALRPEATSAILDAELEARGFAVSWDFRRAFDCVNVKAMRIAGCADTVAVLDLLFDYAVVPHEKVVPDSRSKAMSIVPFGFRAGEFPKEMLHLLSSWCCFSVWDMRWWQEALRRMTFISRFTWTIDLLSRTLLRHLFRCNSCGGCLRRPFTCKRIRAKRNWLIFEHLLVGPTPGLKHLAP